MTTYNIDWQSGGDEAIPGKDDILLPEKTLNTTSTSLTLTGKGISNYGEIQQENFIRLMEHFASNSAPSAPTIGQLWFDAGADNLQLRTMSETWDVVTREGSDHIITGSWTFTNPIEIGPPVSPGDAVTKDYVDTAVAAATAGLTVKTAVEIVVTAPGSLGSFTYNNGTGGVGATLTATVNTAFPTIDGVTLTSTVTGENGVLIAFTGGDHRNGRYDLTQVGSGSQPWVLTRCALCDEAGEIPGSYTFVKRGTTYAGTGWVQLVVDPPTFSVGTDPIFVTQFTDASAVYLAGNGLQLTGNTFDVLGTAGNIVVGATVDLANTAVTAGSYGGAADVGTFTVDAKGRLTAAANVSIAISASQVTTGTLADARLSSNVALRNVNNTFTGSIQEVVDSGNPIWQTRTPNLTGVGTLRHLDTSGYVADISMHSSSHPTHAGKVTINSSTGVELWLGGSPVLWTSGAGSVTTHTSSIVGLTGQGRINLVAGSFTNTGYTEFINPSGGREGYIGFSSSTSGGDAGTIPYVAGFHRFTGRAATVPQTVTFSTTPTFNSALSNTFYFGTLTANVTSVTISNPIDGAALQIRFQQDGTGGRTVTLPVSVQVSGTIDPAANSVTWLVLTYVASASRWEGTWTRIS